MDTILFLSADPTNASRLRLGQELRDIREGLELAKQRQQFTLVERMFVGRRDMTQAILDTNPQIVHFSGSGATTGELCLADESGRIAAVAPDALAALFEPFASQIDCVILNAFDSDAQAKAIATHIDYVVGVKRDMGPKAAIAFAVGFYTALTRLGTIEDVFRLGIEELKLLNIPEDQMPVLVKRGALETQHFSRTLKYQKDEKGNYVLWRRGYPQFATFDLELRSTAHEEFSIFVKPQSYDSIQALLDELFLNYLASLVPPNSYGAEWLLVGRPFSIRAVVPLEWIDCVGEPIHNLNPTWAATTPPAEYGITPNSHWMILVKRHAMGGVFESAFESAYAVALNNELLAQGLLARGKLIYALYQGGYLIGSSLHDISTRRYKFVYVFRDWLKIGLNGKVLIESGKELGPEILSWTLSV